MISYHMTKNPGETLLTIELKRDFGLTKVNRVLSSISRLSLRHSTAGAAQLLHKRLFS
jgi:hypothetical protein